MNLYAAGTNIENQLGVPNVTGSDQIDKFVNIPLPFSQDNDILHIACGAAHTLIVARGSDHQIRLYGAGSNLYKQLNPHSNENRFDAFRLVSLPSSSQGLSDILVSCVVNTSIVVLKYNVDGKDDLVFTMGSNDWNLRGVENALSGITHLVSLPNICAVTAGARHVVLASYDQDERQYSIYGWGACRMGQLGPDLSSQRYVSLTRLNLSHFSTESAITHVPKPCDLILSAGKEHTVIRLWNSRTQASIVILFGDNRKKQLGVADPKQGYHEMIYPENVYLACTWGSTIVVGHQTKHLEQFGTLHAMDESLHKMTTMSMQLDNIDADKVAVGSEHILYWKNHQVHVRGWNEHGNLGLGHTLDVHYDKVWLDWAPLMKKENIKLWGGQASSWIALYED